MSKEAFIFEVSDRSFEKYVIGNSDKSPVFVVFMSVWSEPCNHMSDMFADLATEFAEEFVGGAETGAGSYTIIQITMLQVPIRRQHYLRGTRIIPQPGGHHYR